MKPRLIGLTGPARSGKDSVADALAGKGMQSYALAGPLKAGLRAMFDLTHEHTDGPLKEDPIDVLGGVTPRRLMQTLGTEWARHTVHDDVWLWLAGRKWDRVVENCGRGLRGLVITDIRFDNEAEWIRDRGGAIFHVQRPGHASNVSFHASEAGVAYKPEAGDVRVLNDGTLDDLHANALKALGGLSDKPPRPDEGQSVLEKVRNVRRALLAEDADLSLVSITLTEDEADRLCDEIFAEGLRVPAHPYVGKAGFLRAESSRLLGFHVYIEEDE